MIRNGKAAGKKPARMFIRKALFFIGVYTAFSLMTAIPCTLRAVVLTAVFTGYLYPRASRLFRRVSAGTGGAVTESKRLARRLSRAVSAFRSMSDEEFESRFPDAAQKPARQQPAPFVPGHLCKPLFTKEAAHAAALAWWETSAGGGPAGMGRVAELLSEVAAGDPAKHTCVLTEHGELGLPAEPPVLEALVDIMKNSGLDADFGADEQFIVYWNQYADGKEAAQAHAGN